MNSSNNKPLSPHLIGIVLVVVSAVVFSTVGLFAKGVSAEAWAVIFWRGFFAVIFTTGYIAWRGTLNQDFLQMGTPGWVVAIVGATATAAFLTSFKHTAIANVSVIFASSPLLAIAMAWFWFKERPTNKNLIACLVAFGGVALIVQSSLGSPSLFGDLLALYMTIGMTLFIVIYRRYPNTPAAGPNVVSSLLLLPVCMVLGPPFDIPWTDFLILVVFGLVFAVASVTLTEGARRIPAGETALISLIETPLAPLFAWLILSEVPPQATLVGGTIILMAVISSQVSWKQKPWMRKTQI